VETTRRNFITRIGQVGGLGAAYTMMQSLDSCRTCGTGQHRAAGRGFGKR